MTDDGQVVIGCGGSRNFEECRCSCHSMGAIHCVPCCDECPYCGMRISMGFVREHIERHEKAGHVMLSSSILGRMIGQEVPKIGLHGELIEGTIG